MNIIIDYMKAQECSNQEALNTCLQCGKCGRRFENGVLVDDNGTHMECAEDE